MIGCIRCHWGRGAGWQTADNDVTKLLKGFDIYGDASDKKKTLPDTVERLSGLYSGNLENKVLPRARQDLAEAVLRASGPFKGGGDQTTITQRSSTQVGTLYNDYFYKTVGARQCLHDLGIDVEEKDAVERLRKELPPPLPDAEGIRHEDVRVASLLSGLEITRADYSLIYSFLATRVAAAKKEKP